MNRVIRFLKKRPATLDVLALRDFRYFWVANASADITMERRFVAVAWLVLQLTDSPSLVGMIVGVRVFPVIACALHGRAGSDRRGGRKILRVTRSLTAYLRTSGLVELWALVISALVSGTSMALSTTAWRTMVVDMAGGTHFPPTLWRR